jgi:uncharacterized protein YbgA (DUF1722 family)/uncharacterized protein YbbK (DUF523 family)
VIHRRHTGKIALGISSCLLGQRVRYDGNHKHDALVNNVLTDYFEFIPVCPEVAIGLGTPRPPIHLVGTKNHHHAVGAHHPNKDVTKELKNYGEKQSRKLRGIAGYIFKSRSPSCGVVSAEVRGRQERQRYRSSGVFAREIMHADPLLPVEEEGRLWDNRLRDNFIERVYVYHRWLDTAKHGITAAGLVDFHTRHKMAILSHGQQRYRALGRLIASANKKNIRLKAKIYIDDLMRALKYRATPTRHTNVLMHLMGYLKRYLTAVDKKELRDAIYSYRLGRLPLVVPLTLLQHHFRHYPNEYVSRQTYLDLESDELRLRSLLLTLHV